MEGLMKKKQGVINAAVEFSAGQGYDAATTFEPAIAAGVTEPEIYYHFKSKDGLCSHFFETAFNSYYSRQEATPTDTGTAFEKIKDLVAFHLHTIDEIPDNNQPLSDEIVILRSWLRKTFGGATPLSRALCVRLYRKRNNYGKVLSRTGRSDCRDYHLICKQVYQVAQLETGSDRWIKGGICGFLS